MSLNLVTPDQDENIEKLIEQINITTNQNNVIKPFEWQKGSTNKKISAILDPKDGDEVLKKMAEKFIQHVEEAKSTHKYKINIISHGVGARVIEEVISLISGIEKQDIQITHYMINPKLHAKKIGKVGKYSTAALALGVTILGSSFLKGKSRALLGLIGASTALKLSNKENVSEVLDDDIDEYFEFAPIKRIALCNWDDPEIDELVKIPNIEIYEAVDQYNLLDFSLKGEEQLFVKFKKSKPLDKINRPKKNLKIKRDITNRFN
jgi:hypothetical protein